MKVHPALFLASSVGSERESSKDRNRAHRSSTSLAGLPSGGISGGQRKRAAVEVLKGPGLAGTDAQIGEEWADS